MSSVSALTILAILLALLLLLAGLAAVRLWAPDVPPGPLLAREWRASDRWADCAGGVRLHYRDEGPRDAPALFLLHGYGDSFATWEAWAARLATRWRVISVDLPGHGLTDAPPDFQLEPQACAALVTALARQLGLATWAVGGNSMGGGVAWRVALQAPLQVSALLLVAAAGWPADGPPSPSLAMRLLQKPWGRRLLERIDSRPLVAQALRVQMHDARQATDTVIDRWASFQRLPGHRRILMSASLGGLAQATPALLAGVRAPTLVLHGESDPLIPPDHSRRFAAAITGAQLRMIPACGHLPQRERAAETADAVANFLDWTLPRAAAAE